MLGDHQLLVRRDGPEPDTTRIGADSGLTMPVRALIQRRAEPGEPRADRCANRWRVLPDAAREHEAVQATEGGREGTRLAGDPEGEQLDGVARLRRVAREEHAQVAADTGDAGQPRAVIEHGLDLADRHAALPLEIEHDAGIERA